MRIPKFNWDSMKEVVIAVIGVGLIIAVSFGASVMQDVVTNQNEAEVRGYRNRAEACRLQLGLGMKLSKNCLDPALQGYFDPEENIHTASVTVLCDLARQMRTIELPPKCEETE